MKNFIVWTLSFLLVTEPAVWAASRPTMTDLKAMIEFSELSKHPMTLNELYTRYVAYLPQDVRQQLAPMVSEYGDYEIPKFNVTKAKNSEGQEYYQLSAVKDGKAVTLSVGENSKSLVKINGQALETPDMQGILSILAKNGVAKNDIKQIPVGKRTPAQVNILNAKQVSKLDLQGKKVYFKQLRELLQSMEEVDQKLMNKDNKTSSREPSSVGTFAALLIGEHAIAGGDEACVAAAHVTQIGYNPKRKVRSCGVDENGDVRKELRGHCQKNQFQCNTAVYGHNAGCVDAGRETTAVCNKKAAANGDDIPDVSADAKTFNEFRERAVKQATKVIAACSDSRNGILSADQSVTCGNFLERSDVINGWDCRKPDFKARYKKLCVGPDAPTSSTGEEPLPPLPEPLPGPGDDHGGGPGILPPGHAGGDSGGNHIDEGSDSAGATQCDSLPRNMVMGREIKSCEKGGIVNSWCADREGRKQETSTCRCDNGGKVIGFMKCDGGSGNLDSDSGRDRKHKHSSKKKGPNWLLILGAGLIGIGLTWWLTKKALNQSYKNIDPLPAATPVPVDVVAPPGAR